MGIDLRLDNPADDERKPVLVLLGAHRWKRDEVVALATASGFRPMLLVHETENVPESLLADVGPYWVLRRSLLEAKSAPEVADEITQRCGRQWYVIGLDDYVCEFAAELSQHSAAPTMKATAATCVLRKHQLRRLWNSLAEKDGRLFAVPYTLRSYRDLADHLAYVSEGDLVLSSGESYIVKPDALDASIGVHSVGPDGDIDDAISAVLRVLADLSPAVVSLGIGVAPAVLIERRIPRSEALHGGAEYSAEFLSVKVGGETQHLLLGVTEKYTAGSFIEFAHCFASSSFPETLRESLANAIRSLLDHLGVEQCISHWEFIVTPDARLALVEAQLRPAGDRIMTLIQRSTGLSPYRALFANLLGEEIGQTQFRPKRCAAVFFPQPHRKVSGKLSICVDQNDSIVGDCIVIDHVGIGEIDSWGGGIEWDGKYLAVLTEGMNLDEARKRCENVLHNVRLCGELSGSRSESSFRLPV